MGFFALFCTSFVPRIQSGFEVQIWAKLWHTEAHIDTILVIVIGIKIISVQKNIVKDAVIIGC